MFFLGDWETVFLVTLLLLVDPESSKEMEQLTRRWENLSLSDKEKQDFTLPEDHRKGEFVIAAKFLTSRFLQMEAVARTFKQIWRFNNGFRIRNQGNNTVLFVFDNLADVEKILNSQPWSFDKHLIIMQRYANDGPVNELSFNKVPFWVQVHDIPCSFLTRKIAEKLCDVVGEVQKSIGAVDDDGGSFFRVRVLVDITLPLCRGRVISLPNGSKSWVNFKYERLPNICYWCGRLDHNDRDCELWIESNGTLTAEQQQYDSRLRAPPYKTAGRDVIYVPGFFEGRARRAQGTPVVAQPDEAAPEMEVDWSGGAMNAGSVAVPEARINAGGTSSIEECINHENGNPDVVQPVKVTLGSNDTDCPEINKETEGAITFPNSARSVEEKVTLTAANMGKNNGGSDLIPELVVTAPTIRDTASVEKTLTNANNTTHASNPTIYEQMIHTVDGDTSQSANLRTWKRLLRQPKDTKAEANVEQGKKRKSYIEAAGQSNVPSKRLQVVHADQKPSNLVVAAAQQPRQES